MPCRSFGRRVHDLDGRQDLRHHHRRHETLEETRADQHLGGVGETRECGREREARHADQKQLLVAKDVAEPPAGDQEQREGERIAGDDPLDRRVARAEAVADRGDRHVDDRRIEHVHEEGEEDDERRDRPAAARHRAPGGKRRCNMFLHFGPFAAQETGPFGREFRIYGAWDDAKKAVLRQRSIAAQGALGSREPGSTKPTQQRAIPMALGWLR